MEQMYKDPIFRQQMKKAARVMLYVCHNRDEPTFEVDLMALDRILEKEMNEISCVILLIADGEIEGLQVSMILLDEKL
jgi:hypothetical protein